MRNKVLIVTTIVVVALLSACGAGKAAPEAAEPQAAAGKAVLALTGKFGSAQDLTMDALRGCGVSKITAEHPKKGPQEYEGVFIKDVLGKAEVADDASALVFTADDGYAKEVALADVQACQECIVTIGDDGALGTVMPDMPTNTWIKGLVSIEAK